VVLNGRNYSVDLPLSWHSPRRHGHRHRHVLPRRHPREDRRENVGVSFSLPQEIARVGRVGEDPREDVRVGVGVGVVEFHL